MNCMFWEVMETQKMIMVEQKKIVDVQRELLVEIKDIWKMVKGREE